MTEAPFVSGEAGLSRAPYLEAPALQSYTLHLRHGFFGRNGGVSNGVYRTLNAGHGSDDLTENVATNRDRICAALGAEPGQLVTAHQAHTTRAIIVDEPFEIGKAPEADALITDRPGLVIAALAADCAPVLMCDPHAGIAAAVHAGWRGAVAGVVDNAVDVMEGMGAQASRIIAAVGPCLSQASFEVGPDLVDAVLEASPWADRLFYDGEGDRSQFDLKRYVLHRMTRIGVGKVEAVLDDTLSEPNLYFSYRRGRQTGDADYGRNASAIMLLG